MQREATLPVKPRKQTLQAEVLVGQGLARSIVGKVDAAFLGNLPAPAQKGLGSIPAADADEWLNYSVVDTGATIANLD
ncbi:MAG: hypothetical protein WBX27_15050, partial [Specibacter sp.]